jgi:hypothetical protein
LARFSISLAYQNLVLQNILAAGSSSTNHSKIGFAFAAKATEVGEATNYAIGTATIITREQIL